MLLDRVFGRNVEEIIGVIVNIFLCMIFEGYFQVIIRIISENF